MPTFFESKIEFRAWLKKNAKSSSSLKIGFRTRPNGHACMTWSEAIEEALRFGWCDGRHIAIDGSTYAASFARRKSGAIWSKEQVALAEYLIENGDMTKDGKAAFLSRAKPKADNADVSLTLSPLMQAELKRHPAAWAAFQKMQPSNRQKWTDWVMTAKQEKTRSNRFARLLLDLSRPRI